MSVESNIEQARESVGGGVGGMTNLAYPSNPAPHNIVLVFKDYTFSGTQGVVPQSFGAPSGAVSLPLPTNIRDTYQVKVGEFELGAGGALTAQGIEGQGVTIDAVLGDISAIGDNVDSDSTIGNIVSNANAAAKFFGRNLLDTLGGGIAGGVSVGTGTAVNPHVALKFDGVNRKQHSFNWVLSPKNEAEAESIRGIIRYIKQRMAPSYALAGVPGSAVGRNLLNYPSLVEISFMGVNQDYFHYFKPAMIQSFTANYTPNGVALNRGGRPAVVILRMTLMEAQVWTREDF